MKVVLAFALALAGAWPAAAQEPLKYREGDSVKGHVKSVRVELSDVREENGRWVEGPRRVEREKVYSEDGRRSEETTYRPDGSVYSVVVRTYYEDGKPAEVTFRDAAGVLRLRDLYSRDGGEVRFFDGAGNLRRRHEVVRDKAGNEVERREYDAGGALTRRTVNSREENASVWSAYDGEGRLKSKSVVGPDRKGGISREFYDYNEDGTVAEERRVNSDRRTTHVEHSEAVGGGEPRPKLTQFQEYDAQRNLVKQTFQRWDAGARAMRPSGFRYFVITYY